MSQQGELKNKNRSKKQETVQEELRTEQLEILAEITAQRIVELIKAGNL